MDLVRKLEPLALLFMVIGGLNWGMVGLFDYNVVTEIFSDSTVVDVIYAIVGISALVYIPRLLEALHIGGHSAHPRGT